MVLGVRKKEGESNTAFLRRFKAALTQSGLLLQAKRTVFYKKEPNERSKKVSKIYRLKIQKQVEKLMKQGIDFDTALKRARNFVKYIKYTGK